MNDALKQNYSFQPRTLKVVRWAKIPKHEQDSLPDDIFFAIALMTAAVAMLYIIIG